MTHAQSRGSGLDDLSSWPTFARRKCSVAFPKRRSARSMSRLSSTITQSACASQILSRPAGLAARSRNSLSTRCLFAIKLGTVRTVKRFGSRPFFIWRHVSGIDMGAPSRARATACHRRRHTIVAKIVEEDTPGARLLCDSDHIAVRTVSRHPNADLACEGLRAGQSEFPALGTRTGVTTCKPFPPVVLQKATSPKASSLSRISWAAAITVSNSTSGAGSRSNTNRPVGQDGKVGNSTGGPRDQQLAQWPPNLQRDQSEGKVCGRLIQSPASSNGRCPAWRDVERTAHPRFHRAP